MDYAFVPPDEDDAYARLRQALTNRANTKLTSRAAIGNVKAFLDDLDTDSSVAKPVGGLIVGTHANDDGWIKARFGRGQFTETIYDDVISLWSGAHSAFLVPSPLYSGATPPPKLRIVGCQAGRAPEMLKVLKRLMGDQVPIVASLYFYEVRTAEKHGAWISFRYNFEVHSPTVLKDRAAVIAALKAAATATPADFSYIDGTTPVEPARWDEWLPKGTKIDSGKNSKLSIAMPAAPLGQKFKKIAELPCATEIRHTRRQFLRTVPGTPPSTKEADGKAWLKTQLPAKFPEFKSDHEFPVFRRKGCKTVEEFVDSYKWKFEPQPDSTTNCTGDRHDYTLLVPIKIMEPSKTWAKQRLMFHFYPDTGSGLTAVTSDFTDDDTRIFVQV